MNILVLGLGQSMRGDDAAGLEALRMWEATCPATASRPEIHVEYAETPGLSLLSLLEEAEAAILVDAVQSGAPPGTIHLLTESELPSFLAGAGSAHGWGAVETLALGRRLDARLPEQILVIGIEIKQVEVGAGISPQVGAALGQAAQEIERTVQSLLR